MAEITALVVALSALTGNVATIIKLVRHTRQPAATAHRAAAPPAARPGERTGPPA